MLDDDVSSARVVGYVSDPDGRGTPSLVISCLVTLVLCVWSAVHLNVPRRDQTRLESIFLILRWVIAGIYAPELVVFAAWRQWSSARMLQKNVEETLLTSQKHDSAPPRRFGWTMAHSFFACSGGFALEIDGLADAIHDQPKDEAQEVRRLTLTARGVDLLARCGHLPDVDAEQIEDKSKANDLAKAMVLVQATWMLVQAIGRLASRLPVTLLEVNTVAHVLCAFLMYGFWWHKPLLPHQPIVLDDEQLGPLAAFMYSSSEMSGYVNPKKVKSKTIVKTFFAYLNLYSRIPELQNICLRMRGEVVEDKDNVTDAIRPSMKDKKELDASIELINDKTLIFSESSAVCLDALRASREKESGTAFFERRPQVQDKRPKSEKNTRIDLRRWDLINTAFARYPCLLDAQNVLVDHTVAGDSGATGQNSSRCLHLRPVQLVAEHIQNWPSSDLLRNVGGLVVGMVLWFANLCYGAIHVAAWNDHFPSTAEMWLWRASSSYIAFCGGLWVMLNFIVTQLPRLNEFWERWADGEKTSLENVGLGIVVFICGFSLVLARIFVVVEAFVSIREQPVEAYSTPEWTNVFPHF